MPRRKRKQPQYKLFIPKGKNNIYIGWSEGRRSKRLSTGTTNEKIAQQILADFINNQQLAQNEYLTVNDLIENYKEYKKMEYLTTNAPARNYINVVGFLQPAIDFLGNHNARTLSRILIRALTNHRREEGDSNAKIRNILTYFRASLNHARKDDVIDIVPHFDMPQPHAPRSKTMTPREVRKLIGHCLQPHLRLFVLLSFLTLARKQAIFDLTWPQVQFIKRKKKEIVIVDYNPPGRVKTANKRRAIVPLEGDIVEALKLARKCALTNHVIEYNGKPIKDIRTAFDKACDDKHAKLTWVTPHVIRHTGATLLIMDGKDMEEVAKLMEDDPITVRKNYAHLSPDYLKNVTQGLRDLYKLN